MSITSVFTIGPFVPCTPLCKILNTPVMSICLVKQNDGTWVEKHERFLFNAYKRFFFIFVTFFYVFLFFSGTFFTSMVDFGFKRSRGAHGHHFELLASHSYLCNGCSYKVQILCANALWAVIACGSKNYAGMRRVSQNIIPVKNSPRFT